MLISKQLLLASATGNSHACHRIPQVNCTFGTGNIIYGPNAATAHDGDKLYPSYQYLSYNLDNLVPVEEKEEYLIDEHR